MHVFRPFRVPCAVLLFCAAVSAVAQTPQALFYMTNSPDSVRDFLAHASQIDLLVPTWYSVDQDGLVSGGPDPLVLEAAKAAHVPVEPIVSNQAATQVSLHLLLQRPEAQTQMIDALLREAKQNGYLGFQFDFENIAWTDRDALSALVARAASALHAAGLQLSIATVPAAPGHPGTTPFSSWLYANWRGAYDLDALAKSVDLICLMTYDQQTRWTMPGPVAGWHWTIENLDFALQSVPKAKLSLGIPLYGYHWFTGAPINNQPDPTADYISAPDALDLARTWGGQLQWDPIDRTAWFWFYRDDQREWVFFTDQRTFRERYDLVKQRGLAGFCSWVLGQEDPDIWAVLPSHP